MSDSDSAVWSKSLDGFTAELHHDADAESPRDWGNLGCMVCWHRRHELGDEQPRLSPSDWERTVSDIAIKLPLYLYDHSGLTMNTTGFSCPWDSGQVGWIYVTRESLLKEYGRKRLSKKLIAQATEVLIGEVKSYDTFLRGEVYCYLIRDPSDDVVDSCGGLFGYDYAVSEAEAALTSAAKDPHETDTSSLISAGGA